MHPKSFLYAFFFGNYFYGICAVALSVEAALQQHCPLNDNYYYGLIFFLTIIYYTKAYASGTPEGSNDPRALWYFNHRKWINFSQVLYSMLSIFLAIIILFRYPESIWRINPVQLALILIFPAVAALYYGVENKYLPGFNLRNIGWMKPFVIGFVWAGFVTIYPIIYHMLTQVSDFQPGIISGLLFLKNFMFITVLCIMFDIKDYATDFNQQLKTFVVTVGLRTTIFRIIMPLTILGLGSFMIFAIRHHFSIYKILLNCIPFILMLTLAYSLFRRRSILFYLVLIDGLMLVKALCGTIAMIYF